MPPPSRNLRPIAPSASWQVVVPPARGDTVLAISARWASG